MFAILLSEKMDPFYQNISSFPTVLFTLLLGVFVLYWAGAVLGLVDLEVIDIDLDALDLNPDSPHTAVDTLAGLLLKYGLAGVPLTISLSILTLIGWLASYYLVHFLQPFMSVALIKYPLGLVILLVAIYVGALLTGQIIKPLKPLFEKATQETVKHVVGRTGVVRTSRVDREFGEISVEDGGAGLILKVRTTGDDQFKKGDQVVVIEKLSDDNIYRVISKEEFQGS